MKKFAPASYLFLFFFSLLFTSCGEDRTNELEEKSETQQWIYDTMFEHYYWYDKMPAKGNLNFFSEPVTFFKSLLVAEDGKTQESGTHYYYSYIEELTETKARSISDPDHSYGFEFVVYTNLNYAAHIEYVVAGSPADRAGLKRGEWITQINGVNTNSSNYPLLLGSDAATFTVATLRATLVGNKYEEIGFAGAREVKIDAAETINDNPVFLAKKIQHSNETVGYLVYNHFTAGATENSKEYDNALRLASTQLKGVNDLILDLRYNNGGLVSSAMLLCDILAPASAVTGKSVMAKMIYNGKQKTNEVTLPFGNQLGSGTNLNLERLYVITSSSTASASELIINSLRPYYPVLLIGEDTNGKNVGSVEYKNSEETWKLQPIVCRLYNKDNESDYGNFDGGYGGFKPNYPYDTNYIESLMQRVDLGDENEAILKLALSVVGGYVLPNAKSRSVSSTEPTPAFNSIDRHATNGVLIDR